MKESRTPYLVTCHAQRAGKNQQSGRRMQRRRKRLRNGRMLVTKRRGGKREVESRCGAAEGFDSSRSG